MRVHSVKSNGVQLSGEKGNIQINSFKDNIQLSVDIDDDTIDLLMKADQSCSVTDGVEALKELNKVLSGFRPEGVLFICAPQSWSGDSLWEKEVIQLAEKMSQHCETVSFKGVRYV